MTNKNNDLYDVIIAGAGPSGSSSGYFLSTKGLRVLILDKYKFPREKYCGGGVPRSVFEMFPIENRMSEFIEINEYRFTCRGKKNAGGKIPDGGVISVERSVFDDYLLSCALNEGAVFIGGVEVVDVEPDSNQVTVIDSHGNRYMGKVLVGASGGISRLNEKLNRIIGNNNKAKMGICGYYKFLSEPETQDLYQDTVHLDFNFINGGVAGILPKKDYIWVGAYKSQMEKMKNIRKSVDKFIDTIGLKGEKAEFVGLPIPLYNHRREIARGRVLLVGEAAGLVNPISGEGIKPAVESGKIAAEEIEAFLRDGKSLEEYGARIHSEIGEELRIAGRFAKIAFTFPSIAYDGMIHVANDAVKILNGELSYGDFERRLKKKILRKVGIK
ncbi:MAG: NAD(P)/FAD-dependent oxidoreductase [Candidatus Eremiobacteraeota bacterium]|nr:NAD(P)/FAD-dependent oxidoreductase [Candidatus Eremiobacteraeota bacterium]